MYRQVETSFMLPENFEFPNGGKLSEDNRWVILAKLIPWAEFEEEYAQQFSVDTGAPAKSFRMALGALIIKEKLGTSDRETVEQIKENPYLQYFIGLEFYTNVAPFDPSMFVHFREKINVNLVNKLSKQIVKEILLQEDSQVTKKKESYEKELTTIKNKGKLIIDATCANADIRHPNDLGILNKAREKTEEIIDFLYEPIKEKLKNKPRTYRNIAKKNYLLVAKCRRPRKRKRRKAIKQQLQYVQRNLSHIEQLIEQGASLKNLSKRQYKNLLVIAEIYRQQLWLYENKKQSIENRIVSVSQPHIRPIVRGNQSFYFYRGNPSIAISCWRRDIIISKRVPSIKISTSLGKAGKSVEFGAKLSASCIGKYAFLDKISWDNFNESSDLIKQVELYKEYTGYYPESVHVDKIYRNRKNINWCKERGIRISGPPLGRPPKNVSRETKQQAREDEKIRNAIEGKFGQAHE